MEKILMATPAAIIWIAAVGIRQSRSPGWKLVQTPTIPTPPHGL